MARNVQFLSLVTRLRNELRRSSDVAVSSSDVAELKQVINRNYETLYADYDWPHLRTVFDKVPLSAGQYHYDFPSTLDPERVEDVVVWFNAQPLPLDRGINFDDYAVHDSAEDERADPAQKWDVRWTGSATQYEVWPIPDTSEQEIQFIGIKKFERLVNDSDLCRLDDNLIVAFSAAEIAAAQESKDADRKLAAAQTIYNRLRGRHKGAGKVHTFAQEPERMPRHQTVIHVVPS